MAGSPLKTSSLLKVLVHRRIVTVTDKIYVLELQSYRYLAFLSVLKTIYLNVKQTY